MLLDRLKRKIERRSKRVIVWNRKIIRQRQRFICCGKKNRLYDKLQTQTAGQIGLLNELLIRYEEEERSGREPQTAG